MDLLLINENRGGKRKGDSTSHKTFYILGLLFIVVWSAFLMLFLNLNFERRLETLKEEFISCNTIRPGDDRFEATRESISQNKLILNREYNDTSSVHVGSDIATDDLQRSKTLLNHQRGLENAVEGQERSDNARDAVDDRTVIRHRVVRNAPNRRTVMSTQSSRAPDVTVGTGTEKRKMKTKASSEEKGKKSPTTKLLAAHYIAPSDYPRQYESGPVVSFNSSADKDIVYRFWRQAHWVDRKSEQLFHLDETTGIVTVEETGLYLVYAQVVYHDISGRWSFGIYIADTERVKCLATEQLGDLTQYDSHSHGVYQQCYTSQVMYIKKNQSVTLRCLYGSRKILTKPEFTFWGIVRL